MQAAGIKPDAISYSSLLTACRSGDIIEEARVLFQDMQRDALLAIKALASNAQLRETVRAELRVSMGARGVVIAEHAGEATSSGALVAAAPKGEDADGEEKENTPPQDRLLSLMRKLERGGSEGVGEGQRVWVSQRLWVRVRGSG